MTPLWLSSARNGDLSCVSLGILLLHTHVRDGASKGKPESRQWLDDCFITGLPEKSVRTPQLRLMASAMMFPCNSSPQRSISVSSQMTYLLHLFCLMIRSARFARPIATKIIPAQKNKISASQINLFSKRWLLIDIHLMFSDTP